VQYITDSLVSNEMPASPSAKSPARQRRKDERPQELLDAALQLFVEKGYAATRSEEVARAAGVSKGTLYLYFPSKEDLLKAVILTTLGAQIDQGAEILRAHHGSCRELVMGPLVDWWERVYDSPASGVFKLILAEARNFPEIAEFYGERIIAPGAALIESLLQRGIDRGEFRPLDTAMAVQSILLPMVMLCMHKHSLGCTEARTLVSSPREFVRQHMQLMLDGLSVAAPAEMPA